MGLVRPWGVNEPSSKCYVPAVTHQVRLKQTKQLPELTLTTGQKWHLFLSHIWGTGQDQCATIKRQLTALLPGVSVFLDVDDLESIDKLEEYVDQMATVMIFVSKGELASPTISHALP